MSISPEIENLREQFEAECRRSAPAFLISKATPKDAEHSGESSDINTLEHMVSVIGRLADDMSLLINSSHHLSVEELQPAIRRIVEQRGYLAECGDLRDAQDYEAQVHLYVAIVTRVIKRMRTQHRFGGQWADQPVTPMMFG